MKKALITGITGQDGSYLADLLLEKGYEVHGLLRRNSYDDYGKNIKHIESQLHLHYADLTDMISLKNILESVLPDEVYNLAAQSQVLVSFQAPEYTANVNAFGPMRILDCIRGMKVSHPEHTIKFYQASTSEMFGKVQTVPQNEQTPLYPRSPYAIAKTFAHYTTLNYYEAYGIFACSGILFNHESPRRGKIFVTRKIVQGIKHIAEGHDEILELGNLNAFRDWGHAKDYVRAMWLMMQQDIPKAYVIATGKQYTIRHFVELVCQYFAIDLEWRGSGLDEVGVDRKTNRVIVKINPKYFRPAEVDTLLGDSSLAQRELQWTPDYTIETLVQDMCQHEGTL